MHTQSNRSGKTSRALSGATSTEDPTAIGADCPSHPVSGNVPVSLANLGTSGSHEGSLKGKGVKAPTRWSGLFGSTYKVVKITSFVYPYWTNFTIMAIRFLNNTRPLNCSAGHEDGSTRRSIEWLQPARYTTITSSSVIWSGRGHRRGTLQVTSLCWHNRLMWNYYIYVVYCWIPINRDRPILWRWLFLVWRKTGNWSWWTGLCCQNDSVNSRTPFGNSFRLKWLIYGP